MAENSVTLLGTKGGPAIRPHSSMPTSNLLRLNDKEIVVDCGLGVTKGLVDQGMHLKNLSLIYITHLHSDHYIELGPLLHTAWAAGLATPVEIYGPVGLDLYWDGFCASMKADIDLRIDDEGRPDIRDLVTITPLDSGTLSPQGDIIVSAIRVQHPPLIDCFALSFQTEGVHVVFSGDTAPIEAMTSFAKGADLLIHEAMLEAALPALLARIGNGSDKLMDHWRRSHSFAHDAGAIATKAGVKALALSHLIPADDPAYNESHWRDALKGVWDGVLYVGSDGMKITFPIKAL